MAEFNEPSHNAFPFLYLQQTMTIKPLVMSAVESAINHYLSLDEDLPLFLKPLAGKVIAISITPFQETLYLCPNEHGLQIIDYYPDEADTTLTGSLAALGFMSLSATPARAFFSGDVTITGDLNTGKTFQQLFEKLDIDLEEPLSHLTGDVIAHQVGNLFRRAHSWNLETLNSVQLNITEFLQDETQDLPPEPEIAIFEQQVDQLKEDCERLEAHINRLSQAKDSQ